MGKVLGDSGLGCAHEFLSHATFLAEGPGTITFGLNTRKAVVRLLLACMVDMQHWCEALQIWRICMVATPMRFTPIPIFLRWMPLSPVLVQMSISDNHGGALGKLRKTAMALCVRLRDQRLIFVVESIE